MATLNFKTRGMSSPQGKPKVYFTCHPVDFALYFETIADEILKSQNCAVWYDEELVLQDETGQNGVPRGEGAVPRDSVSRSGEAAPGEGAVPGDRVSRSGEAAPDASGGELQSGDPSGILADLSDMQLIVIPVTSRFLYQDCRARTIEFAFAMEHHIPVLPLMQERGLESEFNRICGDLQFLDRNNCDNTTDTYEEKLHKFLSSVLVDDETAAKVRAAFDAYVFLSYRKRDRKYAKDLMRLIHSNDFCRDIAIWYDEYLTPGENFNDAIRDAMERSRLFTLMVTPNLVNETNYVMTVEYPAAKDAGKPVLPVEVEETSEEALKESYEGIPDCVKSQEQEELARRLAEHLRDLAVRENDSDPQHLFFIGLAYLAGIDVEVDFERAQSMIRTAAEAGLEEAIGKLVSMYRTGEGVARDYREAIRWQERLVESRKRRYQETGHESDGDALFLTQWNLGDFWYELCKLPEAKRVYEEMRNLADGMMRLEMSGALWDLSVSYNKLGDICEAEGDLSGAKAYYAKGLGIREKLNEETGTVESRRDLSVSYNKLGDICEAEGDLSGAKAYYAKGLEIREKLNEETGTVESRRDLSASYERMGDICRAEGDLLGAQVYYAQGLELRKKLSEETGTVESRRDLSVSYNLMGNVCRAEGDVLGARAYYAQGLEIREKLSEETGTVESRRDLSVSYEKMGAICQEEGNLPGAQAYYAKSLEISEKLSEETGTVESRRDLSVSYNKLGDICEAEGDLAGAKAYYAKGLEISEKLSGETGTVESRRDLSVSYNKLGDICEEEGDLAGAKVYYAKGLEISEKLSEETGTFQAYDDLAISYCKLAVLDAESLDMECLKKAYRIWQKLIDTSPGNPDIQRKLGIAESLLKDAGEIL